MRRIRLLFHEIILSIHKKLQHERTIAATYHILQGKESIQTIQDTNLFRLQSYYAIYENLTKNEFDLAVIQLQKQHFIYGVEAQQYELTNKGYELLQSRSNVPLYFNGIKYRKIDYTFLNRLLLMIQVWTNIANGNEQFIPIIDDSEIKEWVRQFYKQTRHQIKQCLQRLYDEIHALLLQLPEKDAALFVAQLTSYKHIGMTMDQLATHFERSKHELTLRITNILHYFMHRVEEDKESFRLLYAMMERPNIVNKLTITARKTKTMLERGMPIDVIAKKRNLKQNTIQDHIVEIALYDTSFDISIYVPEQYIDEIINAVAKTNTFKLKQLKEQVNEKITYFQIRLVLTNIHLYTNNKVKENDTN